MRSILRAGTLGVVVGLSLLGAGGVAAAPGSQAPCSVVFSTDGGAVTADGVGKTATNGSGNTLLTCHADLPAGADVEQGVIPGEACLIVVTGSGRVNAICH